MTRNGSSMAVKQFIALARGSMVPHAPHQPWRVVEVVMVEHDCEDCHCVQIFDVVIGEGSRKFSVCRCCGSEVMHG